jgi:carboxymethylenebutenolidase
MTSQWINISADQPDFGGYLALPKRGTGPAVLIFQEIFGVNGHIRAVADQYAAAGYVALAPDVFWRNAPRVELTYEGADRDRGIELMKKTDVELTVVDIATAAATLRARSEVSGKLAAIGYCFGGRLAYLAAAAGSVDAAVSYYGGGIQNALEHADKVTQPILFHYAGQDHAIPQEAVAQVKQAFAGHANAAFFDYPHAEHGFNCADRASYNQQASALAYGRTLEFLAQL